MLKRLFAGMPLIVVGFLCLFAIAPLWSLTFVPNPIELAGAYPWTGVTHIIAFWVIPPALCLAILLRHSSVLILFVLECVALLMLAANAGTVKALTWIQVALVVVFAVLGSVIADRDLLFPFLKRGSRFWRKHPRTPTAIQALVRAGAGESIHGTISDLSSSGLGVTVDTLRYPNFGAQIGRDSAVAIKPALQQGAQEIQTTVAWVNLSPGFCILGLRATNISDMALLLQADGGRVSPSSNNALTRLWQKPWARRTITAGCLLALIGVFVIRSLVALTK